MIKAAQFRHSSGFAITFTLLLIIAMGAAGWYFFEKYMQLESDYNDLKLNNARHTIKTIDLKDQFNNQQKLISEVKDENLLLKTEIDASELLHAETQLRLEKALSQLRDIKQKSGLNAREIEERRKANEALRAQLSNSDINISNLKSRFTVFEMKQEILFNEGDASLKEKGQNALTSLAGVFRQFPERQIAIQGHTDNQPLGPVTSKKFSSNWDLAANRAASAIDYLQHVENIEPERMILVSYSQYRPVQSNDSPQGQANNRRIEIILMPKDFDFFRESTDL